jgi:hypothetical protein
MSHIFISYSQQDIDRMRARPVLPYRRIKDAEFVLSQALNDLKPQAVV